MKNIITIIIVSLVVLITKSSYADTGVAYIENAQVNGLVFSWELHFERTGEWTSGLIEDALGSSAASFNFNTLGLTNPSLVVTASSPLDNTNYDVSVQIINDKCIVDILFTLNELSGTLPLNVKTKLLTVSMDITNTSLTAELSWDASNTGFFDNDDQNVNTTSEGGSDIPLPVELSSFTANASGDQVELNWETKTEITNYGFDIERSIKTSENEEPLWATIGFIEGNGNSNSPKQYSFTDKNPYGGSRYVYRLKQIDTDGTFEYSDLVEVEVIPTQYELYQNYPNPFNPVTNIKFSLPETTKASIMIYNSLGELVTEVVNQDFDAGYHKVEFNANNYASGVYIYRLVSKNFVDTKKMVLMK